MWNWLRNKLIKQPANVRLLAMRIADMYMVHPKMDRSHVCSHCSAPVGLYPSGQTVLKRYQNVEIVCQVCQSWNTDCIPAPGILDELSESVSHTKQ